MENMESSATAKPQKDASVFRALVVDLDYAVLPGISLAWTIWSEELAPVPLTLDPFDFCRYFVPGTARRGAIALAAAAGVREQLDVDAIRAQVDARFADRLADPGLALREGMAELLTALEARGANLLFLTQQATEAALECLKRIGVKAEAERLVAGSPERTLGFGYASWKEALCKTHVLAYKSVALTTCAASMRGAMFAGTKGVVIPDPMLAFEDTSGADARFETASDPAVLECLGELLVLESA